MGLSQAVALIELDANICCNFLQQLLLETAHYLVLTLPVSNSMYEDCQVSHMHLRFETF